MLSLAAALLKPRTKASARAMRMTAMAAKSCSTASFAKAIKAGEEAGLEDEFELKPVRQALEEKIREKERLLRHFLDAPGLHVDDRRSIDKGFALGIAFESWAPANDIPDAEVLRAACIELSKRDCSPWMLHISEMFRVVQGQKEVDLKGRKGDEKCQKDDEKGNEKVQKAEDGTHEDGRL